MNNEDAFANLADAIVKQAVTDWMDLCNDIKKPEDPFKPKKRKIKKDYSFAELRRFFKGSWCATLCGNADTQYILGKLEQERINALNIARGI